MNLFRKDEKSWDVKLWRETIDNVFGWKEYGKLIHNINSIIIIMDLKFVFLILIVFSY